MLTKRFLKGRPVCQVDFFLPEDVANHTKTACLVGEFNAWDETATPMKQLKGRRFRVTLELPLNRDYAFRYLVNGTEWHNDPDADRHVPHPFGGENSIVSTHLPASASQ
jgi:1,4-alpha-glucan branching enzyme